jgi:(1->4)-alpha-D-glucan 1-alpha-D-glucosylmutase
VDYTSRSAALDWIEAHLAEHGAAYVYKQLTYKWRDGRIKLFVTYVCLKVRNELRELFESGEYIPLSASGPGGENVCAFARRHGNNWVIALVPRLASVILDRVRFAFPVRPWKNTWLTLPEGCPTLWTNRINGQEIRCDENGLPLGDVFGGALVALLVSTQADRQRQR